MLGKRLFLLISILWLMAVFPAPGNCAGDRIMVMVSIPPQQQFVQEIGGEHVRVKAMVKPGASPATYEPTPKQMVSLTEAQVYMAIGVPFEKSWLPKISEVNPKMLVTKTQKGIAKMPIQGSRKKNGEKVLDPHIWLSPTLVRIQAQNIRDALIQADTKNKKDYIRNFKKFAHKLHKIDENLLQLLCKASGKKDFMVYHPSWGYLARSYGLNQIPVERGGKSPSPRELSSLVYKARKMGLKTVFVQPQFSTKKAKVIADSIQGQVVKINPLAENWSENLIQAAQKIKKSLQ